MIEALVIGAAANGLAEGGLRAGSAASGRVRDVLRRERFSESVDDLATEFNAALRESVATAVAGESDDLAEEVRAEWPAVARRLDDLDVVFDDAEAAVARIAGAVAAELGVDETGDPDARRAIERGVADGYRDAVRSFGERIAGTELEGILQTEADVRVASAVDRLEDRLTDLGDRLDRHEDARLRDEGFERLDPLYFRRRSAADPATAWRTGFELADVAAGHHLERQRPAGGADGTVESAGGDRFGNDGGRSGSRESRVAGSGDGPEDGGRERSDRRSVADEILGRLRGGSDPDATGRVGGDAGDGRRLAVVGERGSGKSTLCRAVAARWHGEGGTVLYRQSETATRFDRPGVVVDTVRAAEDPLVVVEDAADAAALADVLEAVDCSEAAVLAELRATDWDRPGDLAPGGVATGPGAGVGPGGRPPGGETTVERLRETLAPVWVPPFDRVECRRAIDRYEAVTGERVAATPADLQAATSGGVGSASLVAARLAGPAPEGDASALDGEVRAALREFDARVDGDRIGRAVGTFVALLAAADLPVAQAYVHALATDRADHHAVEAALDAATGPLLVERERERTRAPGADDGDRRYRAPPTAWAVRYLERTADDAAYGRRRAVDLFEDCVGALFALAGSEARRANVREWLRGSSPELERIDEDPAAAADRFVDRVSRLAVEHPPLAPLLGTVDDSRIDLPASCSTEARLRWTERRARGHRRRSATDAAQREYEALLDRVEGADLGPEAAARWESAARTGLGSIATTRGDLEAARRQYEQSLSLARDREDPSAVATARVNLGNAACRAGDLAAAEAHYRAALDRLESLDRREAAGACLDGLGRVARERGDHETAVERFRESIAVDREAGDRRGVAASRHNLGDLRREQGAYEAAADHLRESLAIDRAVGNRRGVAVSLHALGRLARKRGDHDRARDRLEESLAVCRAVGDRRGEVRALSSLGTLARERGEYDRARSLLEDCLAVAESAEGDVGDPFGTLTDLGSVAYERGDHERARERYREALRRAEDDDDRAAVARTLVRLGNVAYEADEPDVAAQRYERALSVADEDDHEPRLWSRENLGHLARSDGDHDRAAEQYRRRLRLARASDDDETVAAALADLATAARERGDLATAREHHERRLARLIGDADDSGDHDSGDSGDAGDADDSGDHDSGDAGGSDDSDGSDDSGDPDADRDGPGDGVAIGPVDGPAIAPGAVESPDAVDDCLADLIDVTERQGDPEAVRAYRRSRAALADAAGDPETAARAYGRLGDAAVARDDRETAREHYRAARDRWESAGAESGSGSGSGASDPADPAERARVIAALGDLARRRDDPETAREQYRESLAVAERGDDPAGRVRANQSLGDVARAEGDLATAADRFERALSVAESTGDGARVGRCRYNLGLVAEARGDREAAVDQFERARESFETAGDLAGAGRAAAAVGRRRREAGDLRRAAEQFEAAVEHLLAAGTGDRLRETVADLAEVYGRLSDPDRARRGVDRLVDRAEAADRPAVADRLRSVRSDLDG